MEENHRVACVQSAIKRSGIKEEYIVHWDLRTPLFWFNAVYLKYVRPKVRSFRNIKANHFSFVHYLMMGRVGPFIKLMDTGSGGGYIKLL